MSNETDGAREPDLRDSSQAGPPPAGTAGFPPPDTGSGFPPGGTESESPAAGAQLGASGVYTLFADVSHYQVPVDDHYPYKFLSIRSNDGTVRDTHFAHNYAWAKQALASGRLTGLIIYFVWRQNWQAAVDTHISMCGGRPHPKQATMVDAESWGGQIKGDQSAGLNAARAALVKWYGGNKHRVIGYGNARDLNSLWPKRGDIGIVLANYSANPTFAGKVAHQFSDKHSTPPFGPCDINSADGRNPAQFAALLGLG